MIWLHCFSTITVLILCLPFVFFAQSKYKFSDTIPAFSSVMAKGNVTVVYRQDDFYSVSFKGKYTVLKDVYSSIKVDKFSLKIDASKLFQNEEITVEVIAPFLDTLILYEGATFYTPTNVWLKKLHVEMYSQRKSTIYVNAVEFHFSCKGSGTLILSGLIDILYVNLEGKVKLESELISKFSRIKTMQHSVFVGKGSVFACECHSFNHSVIDASQLHCGRAKAFASDQSTIEVKSEEKPLILTLSKAKINFIANDAIIIDSTQTGNIKQVKQ